MRACQVIGTLAGGERTRKAKVDYTHAPREGAARGHKHGVFELDVMVGVASGVHEENGNRGLDEALREDPFGAHVRS